jgi:hypothetical protein
MTNVRSRDEVAATEPLQVVPEPRQTRAVDVTAVKNTAADWLFAGVIVMTAWLFLRWSSGLSFLRDDWKVATRSLSFGDLFEPYNGHLSIVPLAIYRVLLGEFGFETYTPYRLLGITSLLCLGIALFLFARSRVGAPVALVTAVSVLWLPTTNLTPFLANFHIALVCAVVCAAAMPSVESRSDIVVGLALAVALANSSVGVAVAAACAVHAATFRPRPSRWTAVAAPSLLWLLWWRTLGDQPRPPNSPSILSALDDVAEGVFGSFGALTGGWWVGGAVLLAAWVILFVHRVWADRASALTQLAWTAGLVVWWVGLVWSRPGAAGSHNIGRYEYVGAVLILLSALPASPAEWLRTVRARWRMAAPALLITGAIVFINHDELRHTVQGRAAGGERAETVLYELEQLEQIEPVEPMRPLIPELARITVRDYHQKVVARYGSLIDLDQPPDAALIERHAVRVPMVGPAPSYDLACAAGPVTLRRGDELGLHTGDEPAMVRARRFGSSMEELKLVAAHRSAVVLFPGPTIVQDVPWVIEAPGACIHELPLVEPGTASTHEGDAATRALHVPVSLSVPSDQPITVAWRTQPPPDGTGMEKLAEVLDAAPADTPGDYPARSGTVTFRPGDTDATITVSVNGDTESERDEFVLISFTATAADVKIGGLFGLGVVEISNDD